MHHVIACVFCGGMDPNADSLLLQAAIAGGITMPWMLRAKLRAMIDRVRSKSPSDAALACPMPDSDDPESPASAP